MSGELAAVIPVADMAAANTTLEQAGYGPGNFSVALWEDVITPEFAGLHTNGDPTFAAAVKAIANVQWSEIAGTPRERFEDAISKVGAFWARNFPELEGQVTPGYYKVTVEDDSDTWLVIQAFDRDVFSDALETYPALVRRVRKPGEVLPWVQPIDQFDAYKLVNAFTGEPDRVTHNGQTWEVTQADGSGNNIWEPGVFGWTVI